MRVLTSMHSACVCWKWQPANIHIKNAQILLRSTVVLPPYVLQVVTKINIVTKLLRESLRKLNNICNYGIWNIKEYLVI